MTTRTVYGIEYVYSDADNYPASRPLGEDLYEDKEQVEALVLSMNKGVVRPTSHWDCDYYTVCDYTLIPKTFKEWP